MKVLKQIFIVMFTVVGLSLTVSAQKDKPQDKPKPPVIKPGDKQPRPKDDKPKKPNMSFFVMVKTEEVTSAE